MLLKPVEQAAFCFSSEYESLLVYRWGGGWISTRLLNRWKQEKWGNCDRIFFINFCLMCSVSSCTIRRPWKASSVQTLSREQRSLLQRSGKLTAAARNSLSAGERASDGPIPLARNIEAQTPEWGRRRQSRSNRTSSLVRRGQVSISKLSIFTVSHEQFLPVHVGSEHIQT